MAENLVLSANLRDKKGGKTILHLAAENNDVALVKHLLSDGVDINFTDNEEKTALHYAAISNEDESHFKVIKFLLRNGANPNARNKFGSTPLHFLIRKGNVKMVQLFLTFNADINLVDSEGQTVLFSAIDFNKNVEVLQLLLDLGLDVNHQTKTGQTPLNRACNLISKNIKIIKCLLKNGAYTNTIDHNGKTPLIKVMGYVNFFGSFPPEIKFKTFNFIMEHIDFKEIHNDFLVLSSILHFTHGVNNSWKMILQHLAKLHSLDIPVHRALLVTISSKSEYNYYYEQCQEELLLAKKIKLKNSWVTLHNLLVDSRKKLKNYAGNKDLIEDFSKINSAEIFSIFGASMCENVLKGIRRRKLFDLSAVLLSDCLPILNPTHLIIRDILDCILTKKDLTKFCDLN